MGGCVCVGCEEDASRKMDGMDEIEMRCRVKYWAVKLSKLEGFAVSGGMEKLSM